MRTHLRVLTSQFGKTQRNIGGLQSLKFFRGMGVFPKISFVTPPPHTTSHQASHNFHGLIIR